MTTFVLSASARTLAVGVSWGKNMLQGSKDHVETINIK